MVFRLPEELETLQNNPTDSGENICLYLEVLTYTAAHMRGLLQFCQMPNYQGEEKKGNALRGKIFWKVGVLSKTDALSKQALLCLMYR